MIEEKENLSTQLKENAFSNSTEEKKDSWVDIIKFVLLTAAIVLPIRFYIAQPFMVSGPSMVPTFNDKDYLIVDEISYRFRSPSRGEIVIFRKAGESKYLIKRIIGVPGDTLVIEGDTITVTNAENPKGFVLNQSFLINKKFEPKLTAILDGNDYFVLGDNRPVSSDSRIWGVLPGSAIIGRPLLRLYPFNMMGFSPGDKSERI